LCCRILLHGAEGLQGGEHETGEPASWRLLSDEDQPNQGSAFQELLEHNGRIEVIDHSAPSTYRH